MNRKIFTIIITIASLCLILGGCATADKVCKAIAASQEEISDTADESDEAEEVSDPLDAN